MKTRRFLFGLLCLNIFLSCKKTADLPQNEINAFQVISPGSSDLHYFLTEKDTIKIRIDSLTAPINWVNHFTTYKNEDCLILYNKNLHSLQFYSIDKGLYFKTIQLNKEGIHSIEPVTEIYFVNMDSIILTVNSPERKLLLIDSVANIKKKWEINDTLKFNNVLYDLYIYKNFDISYSKDNKCVTLSISPYFPVEDPRCYQYPYLIDYNLISGKVESNYGQFPFEDDRVYLYSELPKHLLTDSFDIVHFSGSHNLFFYDLPFKKLVKIFQVKSKYLPEKLKNIDPVILTKGLSEKEKEYYVSEGRYDKLLKDRYRNVYYRIVKLPMDYLYPDGKSKWEPDFLFSIMILDNKFKIIHEQTLPANTYNVSLSTVTKKGLLISLNNINNNQIDEDHIYFRIFSLQNQK